MPNGATPSERSIIAQIAAHDSWARTPDRAARTAPARRALDEKFEREVDPDSLLPPQERAKRVENARKAYYSRLALRSAQARRRRLKHEAERPQERHADLGLPADGDTAGGDV